MSSRRVFTREYKLAAIKKIIEQGLTFVEAAREMGISDSALRAWKKEFELNGTLQNQLSQSPSVEAELKRLREENRQLKMERDVLKKPQRSLPWIRSKIRIHQRAPQRTCMRRLLNGFLLRQERS